MQVLFTFSPLDLLSQVCYNGLKNILGIGMDKIEFFKTYNISDATPSSPTLEIMTADGFASAIEEFINEKFGGIAHVHLEPISSKPILCSAEYTAFFFKTLLADIYGRVFLDIQISSNDKQLIILINHDAPLPLCDREMRNIIRMARNAGMIIMPRDGSISLTLSFSEAAIRRIYAVSARDSKHIMLYKLSEIFHCGAISFTAKKN